MSYQLITSLIVLVLIQSICGGPLQKRSKREIYPELEPEKVEDKQDMQPKVCVVGDLVYTKDESVPSEQPCLKCKCQPPGVHCETTQCEKKPGCRAIHKPNTCCPDYQCECEHEGSLYANGERLEQKPGTECKVCYCRGGEVQCAEVTCYIRADCEGHQVPGKCCPKYEHCPPKEPQVDRSLFIIEAQNITRLEPIAITENEINKSTSTEATQFEKEPQDEITIQEIIPAIKEIPITNSPKREIHQTAIHGQLLVEEAINIDKTIEKHVENQSEIILNTESNDVDIPDSESGSSEVSEVYQQAPVLRIGDKLLFLKKGELVPEKDASTQSSVITIIGAEGLQRGFEDSFENHDSKADVVNKTQDDLDRNGELQTVAESIISVQRTSSEILPTLEANSTSLEVAPINNSTEFELLIDDLEVIPLHNLTELSLEDVYAIDTNTTFDLLDEFNDTIKENVTQDDLTTDFNISNEETTTTTHKYASSTTPQNVTTDKEEIQELNPEYPPIPDVMSPQNADKLLEEVDTTKMIQAQAQPVDTKILPDVLEMRNNRTIPQNSSNSEWLKQKTLINTDAILPDVLLEELAPSDLDLPEITTEDGKTHAKVGEVYIKSGIPIENNQFTKNHIKALTQEDFDEATLPSERPMESLEQAEDSDELITDPSVQPSEVVGNENASIEDVKADSKEEEVELIPGLASEADVITTTAVYNPKQLEVEMIDTDVLMEHTDTEMNSTHQDDFSKNIATAKPLEESEQIFGELDREIGLVAGDIIESKSQLEDSNEAEMIFKELLEETDFTSTPKSLDLEPRNRETAVLQRVSNAIAKFQLRDTKQSLDSSILGILRDFFSSQYRSYNKK